ncbi:MAG: right-handed parallel beta-helix repeat-containing protein [Bacteroidota bacterium]
MTGAAWRDGVGCDQRRENAGARRPQRAWTILALVALVGAGCGSRTRDNPAFCQSNQECGDASYCDVDGGTTAATYTCVPRDSATGGGGRAGTGGAAGAIGTGGMADAGVDVPQDGGGSVDAPAAEVSIGCPTACAAPTSICDTTGVCVCQASDCAGAAPICGSTGVCAGCATSEECKKAFPATPLCASTGKCVACKGESDCAMSMSGSHCFEGQCVPCTVDGECRELSKPICNAAHTCEACTTHAQCVARNENTRACVSGQCVECEKDTECNKDPAKPICVGTVCKACTADAQCVTKLGANPGVCMAHAGGRCALDAEVIYVRPAPGCDDAMSATGTAAVPFCKPQRGVTALTPDRKVIVMRKGTLDLELWSYGGALDLTVVGQGGAVIGSGTGVGITITSGNVYLREVGVSGMLNNGVSVSGTATIRMDRCLITHNMAGGLSVDGAAGYDIQNSVFADNNGTILPVTFGGVQLNSPGGATSKFWNNTITGNGAIGLACAGPYPVRGLLLAANTISQISGCVPDASSLVAGDPAFDPLKPYHLTAASACVNKGGTTDYPPTDLDGKPRPSGPASDCGAHEFQQ